MGAAYVGFDATRRVVMSGQLEGYRIVHFATHALINEDIPALSGLVLSLIDRWGKPVPGFAGLEDIYNLNLTAELVVLSACKTAAGKEIEGEGVVGLTRAFLYAGALRVLGSLWEVDDHATADLMGCFYGAMEKNGMNPAAALRQAQIRMWQRAELHSSGPRFSCRGRTSQNQPQLKETARSERYAKETLMPPVMGTLWTPRVSKCTRTIQKALKLLSKTICV
jgi:CHAT domain-containing protein